MERKTLNLIPRKSFEEYTASKKIFFWMIGVGRIVVVGTELIAILVWLSRFKLDYEISSLQERIEDKQAIIRNADELERSIREDQEKINLIKLTRNNKILYSKGLTNFTGLIPEEVFLTNLSFNGPTIFLNARASSGPAFANLIASLLRSEYIENITLTRSVFNTKENIYDLSLTLEAKKEIFN